MLSISLGPLALPVAPLLLVVASVVASIVADQVARREARSSQPPIPAVGAGPPDGTQSATGVPGDPHAPRTAAAATQRTSAPGDVVTWAVMVGVLAARLGHLALNAQAYADSPAAVFDIRDGGWHLASGLAGGMAWLLWRGWRAPALRRPLAAGATAGLLLWGAGLALLHRGEPTGYPDVTLARLADGQAQTLAQAAQGRPVVVNLWASWCGPCREEMPALAAAQQRHPDVGFLFVNQGETPDKVRLYLAREGLPLQEVLLDPSSTLGRAIGSGGLPTTLFLDPQGRHVDAHFGVLSASSLQARVEALRRASKR
jgi:thiol-disulfide isomerase/thioredoxin